MRASLDLGLIVLGDGLLQQAVLLENLHLVDVPGHLRVDVTLACLGVLRLELHLARRLTLAGTQVVAHFQLGDDVFAVWPLGQAQIEDVSRRLVTLQ